MTVRGSLALPVPRMARRMCPRDPRDIDGLTVWLDARYVDRDSSGNVSRMIDLSGRGNHAVQATAGNRPTYAIVGGRPAVVPAAGKLLNIPQTTDTDPSVSLGLTVYVCVRSSEAAGFAFIVGKYPSVAATNAWLLAVNRLSSSTASFVVTEVGTNTDRLSDGSDASTGATVCLAGRFDPSALNLACSVGGTGSSPAAIAGAKSTSAVTWVGSGVAAAPSSSSIFAVAIVRRYLMLGSADDVFMRDFFRRTYGAP